MTQMYSNARLSKLYGPLKAPRSAVDEFEVGTHRPSYTTFSENTLVPRHRQKTKQLFDASMKATLVYPKPEIYQLDPSIVKFSSLQRANFVAAASTTETPAVPYSPRNTALPSSDRPVPSSNSRSTVRSSNTWEQLTTDIRSTS